MCKISLTKQVFVETGRWKWGTWKLRTIKIAKHKIAGHEIASHDKYLFIVVYTNPSNFSSIVENLM